MLVMELRYSVFKNAIMQSMSSAELTHLDEGGNARMIDVGQKPVTARVAVAKGEVHMLPETLELIRAGNIKKGDVLTVAKVAGISASKRTSELIPFCHPLAIEHISIDFELDSTLPGISITSTVSMTGKTGVEMEALTAVSIAALTIYDMAKAVEKTMSIQNVRLVRKTGGQSGDINNE